MKIAVFLRGHKRIWEYTKRNILEFCNGLSDQVDYYVAVWQNYEKPEEIISMQSDFPNDRLKAFIIATDIDINGGAGKGPAHLSSVLSSYRLVEEVCSKQKYDLILDTRFDVVFKKICNITIPSPFTIGSTQVDQDLGLYKGMEDYCFVADRLVHTIWCHRVYQTHDPYRKLPYIGHAWFTEYAKMYGIKPYNIPWFKAYIVRPSYATVDIDTIFEKYHELDYPWHCMTNEEKKKIILDIGCYLDEYLNQFH